jgi:hypothetical protein
VHLNWLTCKLLKPSLTLPPPLRYTTLAVSNPVATTAIGGPLGAALVGVVNSTPRPLARYLDTGCEKYRPQNANDLQGFLVAALGRTPFTEVSAALMCCFRCGW